MKTSAPEFLDDVLRRRAEAYYFIKKETPAQVELCKILKNTFLESACGRLLLDISEF